MYKKTKKSLFLCSLASILMAISVFTLLPADISAAVRATDSISAAVRADGKSGDLKSDTENSEENTGSSGTVISDKDRMLPEGEKPDASLRISSGTDKPSWYPKEPSTFPFYHDEDAPRVVDTADIFSEEEEARMEARLAELRPQLQKDIVIFTDLSTYGLSRPVYAADFYDFNGYGIGDDREGMCLMICMDPENRGWWACCTGPDTMALYTEEAANQIDDILYDYMKDGKYGTGVADWIENIRRLYTADSRQMLPDGEMPDNSLRVGKGSDKPAWYPGDCAAFPFYHDEDAPRVIDEAGYFSHEEKKQLERRLSEVRTQLDRDIVICIDSDTYGFSDRVYSADFYDFNGYGIGDEREGVCLFIHDHPETYSWNTYCVGSATKGLYSYYRETQIRDMFSELMDKGKYSEAVFDWVENIRRLYTTGSPYSEDWALLSKESIERYRDSTAPRVTDETWLLTDEELDLLTEKAAVLSEKYDLDIVIHLVRNEGILERDEYGDMFWYVMGYGFGSNYDGIELTIFKQLDTPGDLRVTAFGKGLERLTDVNRKRLSNQCKDLVLQEKYYEAADRWLDLSDHMLRKGRVPRTKFSWSFFTALELIIGAIISSFSLSRAKEHMTTPAMKTNADNYLVPGSLKIRNVEDKLIDTKVNRIYDPLPDTKKSSGKGGGRSGGSSYSSGYSGSSGSSHSGSGRSF